MEKAADINYFYQVQYALLYIEKDAEIFPVHYTWKVAEKGFKMAFMMNKLAMNNSSEILLNFFFAKFKCALYSYADYTQ